jgi:hypothetical protein
MSKYEEYLICKVRGHNPDPNRGSTMNASYNAVPTYICVYCGTTYWTTTTTEEHEENAPTPDQEKSIDNE